MVKNPLAMQETWIRSLGWEDPLKEGMATHSSITAWRIPKDRGAWRATVHGASESDTTEQLSTVQCIYVKSGVMVLMDLSSGKQWRCSHTKRLVDTVGRIGE